MNPKNMAFLMAKKKKMAQGGYVEKNPVEKLHESHDYADHFQEPEPEEHDLHGMGFAERDIADNDEKYDVEPEKFADGGMCYMDGGEVTHPLDMMFRKKFLEAKKMAYGGPIETTDISDEPYPPYKEDNMQMERGTHTAPMKHEAEEEDRDRKAVAFARGYMMKKGMRR